MYLPLSIINYGIWLLGERSLPIGLLVSVSLGNCFEMGRVYNGQKCLSLESTHTI